MAVAGLVLICLAGIGFLWALWVSFDTEGGAIGQTPVLAYAVSVPLLGFLGLYIFDRAHPQWSVPWWVYLGGFLLVVILVGWLISVAGRLGERHHDRRARKPTTG